MRSTGPLLVSIICGTLSFRNDVSNLTLIKWDVIFALFVTRCVYDVTVEPCFDTDVVAPPVQKVQVLIPGAPDPPQIFTRAVNKDEFVIEWAEPKLYVTKVKGYQVSVEHYQIYFDVNKNYWKLYLLSWLCILLYNIYIFLFLLYQTYD